MVLTTQLTCFTALVDKSPQGLADAQTEVRAIIQGHTQRPSNGLKRCQQIGGFSAEPR